MLCRGWHALLCGQPPCTSYTAPRSFSSDSFLSLAATPQRLSRFDGIHGPVLAVHWRPFSSWAGLRSSLLYLGPSWPSVRITDELTRAKQTPVLLAPPLFFFFWTSQMTQSLEILTIRPEWIPGTRTNSHMLSFDLYTCGTCTHRHTETPSYFVLLLLCVSMNMCTYMMHMCAYQHTCEVQGTALWSQSLISSGLPGL